MHLQIYKNDILAILGFLLLLFSLRGLLTMGYVYELNKAKLPVADKEKIVLNNTAYTVLSLFVFIIAIKFTFN